MIMTSIAAKQMKRVYRDTLTMMAKNQHISLQTWKKRWRLGCVNPASWLLLAAGGELTQPSLRLFLHVCTSRVHLLAYARMTIPLAILPAFEIYARCRCCYFWFVSTRERGSEKEWFKTHPHNFMPVCNKFKQHLHPDPDIWQSSWET